MYPKEKNKSRSPSQDPVAALVISNSLFGTVLSGVVLSANSCDNYYGIYLFLCFTILQILFYLMVLVSYPISILIALYLICIEILVYRRGVKLRNELHKANLAYDEVMQEL